MISGEAVNFGVVLVEEGWPERAEAFAGVRLAPEREWARMERAAPGMEPEVLRAMGEELARDLVLGTRDARGRGGARRAAAQVRGPVFERGGVEADGGGAWRSRRRRSWRGWRGVIWSAGRRGASGGSGGRQAGRIAILERMRAEFEAWRVWELMAKGIEVRRYVETRNPLKIDLGYGTRDKREFKMYHAVALGADANAASRLAAAFPRLRAGIGEREGKEASLTAMVAAGLDRESDEVGFALEAFAEAGVKVEDVGALGRIAARAAEELL